MTVHQLRHEMSNEEYMRWGAYHGLRGQRMELAQKMAGHSRTPKRK
jgi:hypothetical protein